MDTLKLGDNTVVKLEASITSDLLYEVDNRYLNSIVIGYKKSSEPPIIEIRYNGDIFVKGVLIENDIELVEAFKNFFKQQGLYGQY